MFGITRALIDTAGGLVATTPQAFVRAEGFLVAVVGSTVADHGTGAHDAATLAIGSPFVRINGLAVVRAGLAATCGDLATGSLVVRLAT